MDHHLQGRKQVASPEVAIANEVFDQFCNASTLKSILGYYRHLCDLLKLRPTNINQFYPKLKSKLRSWKAQALWKKFDQRANHKCYNRGKACSCTRVLIIGGGPCGLRSAIEAQLLGAKVVVIEKRDRMSRNNVLHLWPFVIQDLRSLGAKKFFGKFCAGAIDHISIRQLQCILLKVALILGVEFHENVSFDLLLSPPENQDSEKIGWRAKFTPSNHPVSQYEFDVLIGADGKRNTLDGFRRKEFRGKLAIAITANFINKRTEAEARVEEISGVAFIFNQKFFKELYQETGIDLENIVYYKDDTHYFVMTAKKHSLIDKGVILQDHADTAKLLDKENVDREALMLYAREAAEFSTEYQMMDLEFAVNHYGQPDVAMFDFTSMYAAENASRIIERRGHRLFMSLVGDSLLEPFWPTGSGCARGFLSSLDACWAIKGWGASLNPLEVLAERESIYRLLGQTTPENLNRDYAAYTLDPHTRYPNLNIHSVTPIQVRSLLDTDDPENIKQPPFLSTVDVPKKRRRRDFQIHPENLLRWLQKQVDFSDSVKINDMGTCFKNGLALCAIIHRYRPDLIDFQSLSSEESAKNNQLAFDILQKEFNISPIMTGEEMAACDIPDKLSMFSYLTHLYEAFRGEIPHIKHLKLEFEERKEEKPTFSKYLSQVNQDSQLINRIPKQETTRVRHSRVFCGYDNFSEKVADVTSRRSRKRRSTEKMGATVAERQKRLEDIEKNRIERMMKRQYLRKMATQQFYKSIQMLSANAKREKEEPFEDYSIFLYRQTAPDFKDRVKDLEMKILYPDRDPKMHFGHHKKNADNEFSGRIKNIEDKLKGTISSEKKPKDLLRAIGKIEKTDWNVKEIEKKIEENKMGRGVRSHDKVERVPKWSREQFLARQIKMEKKGHDSYEIESKYADIDNTLKTIDRKIKEGNVLGHNKVSAMAEQFSTKNQDSEPKVQRSNSKVTVALPTQGGSEMCHFCNKRVYLMERLSAEGKFFHRGCFRCEYCSTSLRIGNHTFDRGKNGGRFYCSQHLGLLGTMKTRMEKKKIPMMNKENIPNVSINTNTPDKPKVSLEGVTGLDLLDRGQTPERIEFENLARVSDAEDAHSQMDEDEWTDRNFGASAAEMGSSDDISDLSDSEEDNEVFEEAIDQPLTTEGTLELAKNWTLRYSQYHPSEEHSDTGSNEYEDSTDECTSEDDDSATATENEDDVRARELRKQEVWLKVPSQSSDTDTGSETEVASDESTEDSEENSATEISTDSEFEHDGTTPTQHEIPKITINDAFVRKTRGDYIEPKIVQIKSHVINSSGNRLVNETKLNLSKIDKPIQQLDESNSNLKQQQKLSSPLINPRTGDYSLNRTHSTEGIASKLSLELKKRYLLGGLSIGGSVIKSGSTSNVNTKLTSFTDSISQHQKLLNPAPEPSPTMQAFLKQGANKISSSSSSIVSKPSSKTFIKSNISSIDESLATTETHLPDLIKDSSILKSKTDSNITLTRNFNNDESKIKSNIKENNANKEEKGINEEKSSEKFQKLENSDDHYRPRSPLHETCIIVPQVNWNRENTTNSKKENESSDSEMDSDSLSLREDFIDVKKKEEEVKEKKFNLSRPKLQIHSTDGDLLLDETNDREEIEPDSIECMRLEEISKEIESVKNIEIVNNNMKQLELEEEEEREEKSICISPTSIASNNKDDSDENDVTTAAYTETEYSEWARDGDAIGSEDIRDVELGLDSELLTKRKSKNILTQNKEDIIDTSNDALKLLANGEDLDFMDTDNEESLLDDSLREASNNALLKNRGYIEFVNFKTLTPTKFHKLSAPIAKIEVENDVDDDDDDDLEIDNIDVIKINPVTMDDVIDKLNGAVNKFVKLPSDKNNRIIENNDVEQSNKEILQMDEDSLLIVEPAEDTTTSELITVVATCPQLPIVPQNKDELLDDTTNTDYLEYVKRLQSRIAEFSNAKDSIDIRKSKRKNSKSLIQLHTNDIISEEIKDINKEKDSLDAVDTTRKLEEITRERSKQKTVIQNLLMDKLEAHKQKSAEKKAKRAARASSFSNKNLSPVKIGISAPPNPPPSSSSTDNQIEQSPRENKILSVYKPLDFSTPQEKISEFTTPIAPPRTKHEETKKTTEKAKQDARERARLKSDQDLGLSPEDKIKELRMKVARRQHYSEERRKNEAENVRPQRLLMNSPYGLKASKSTDNFKTITRNMNFDELKTPTNAKSMDELLQTIDMKKDETACVIKRDKRKLKDSERRKSIIQAVSDFFKKKDSSPTMGKEKLFTFRLTPKSKEKGKLFKSYSDASNMDKSMSPKFDARPKSVTEGMLVESFLSEVPPPLPPLPLNYTALTTHMLDGNLSDDDSKTTALSTSQANKTDDFCNSISRKTKATKRIARQAQLKRLRMAQEIQRKLEETEVKQRELECRGVSVEKALRGEGDCSNREEADLLREWFDLMRERTELRRYEKELLVRAQEVQLEDRHERLQQELRERLADDDQNKTSADVKKEGEILTEMLEIVAKRDSLIALLEEERQRYQDEDRDLEAQMLAKGLRLTPVKRREKQSL
ncbi:F-actin-monooxygenase Mical isoform X2 [Leptopilina boulardi]|uniref:F-actin-monooxygenase Mical isoform X2 n=1 Tax=Leptopilina boulardi TaxID=63433 RepID=UPI0021F5D3DD|nr:F-actin-monooxygenase Mical isoform X2 [Leptopilina boulardi]